MAGPGCELEGALEATQRRRLEHQRRDAVLATQLRRAKRHMGTHESCKTQINSLGRTVHQVRCLTETAHNRFKTCTPCHVDASFGRGRRARMTMAVAARDPAQMVAPSSTDSSSATGTPVAAKKAPMSAASRVGSSTYSSRAGAAAQPKLTASSSVHLRSQTADQLGNMHGWFDVRKL